MIEYVPTKYKDIQVRWLDEYSERFSAEEGRAGAYLLWMRLENGENRHISLSQVRWYDICLSKSTSLDCTKTVQVRWFDGHYEEFPVEEYEIGAHFICMKLAFGNIRHIPLSQVRWYATYPESHARVAEEEKKLPTF